MKNQSKPQSSKKISASESHFMKLAKASYSFAKKNEDLISTVEKRANLLDSMFSKKHASLKTTAGLKDLAKKIDATSASIKSSISEVSNKLDAAYICSVKASSEKQKKIASKLIKAHALDLEKLSGHNVYFSLLSKKIAADIAEQENEISDEQFLEIDENGYIEEPETVMDEAEEFNETFTSEDEEMEESDEVKEDEKDEFDSSFKSEDEEMTPSEEMDDEIADEEFDEETIKEDEFSEEFESSEDLDDESILDTLEDEEAPEEMTASQAKAAPSKQAQKAAPSKQAQKDKKLAYCTPQSTKHSSNNEDDLVMRFLNN